MINNDALPDIEIDPETFAITIDGDRDHARRRPSIRCPLAQLYKPVLMQR